MSDPLVSVVTPSYNHGRFIRSTIESVLQQDYPRIEYIIMDGGSSDETASVAKDYASRLTWISEKDRGQSHAINKGFRRSRGSILFWLNSDDLILPGAVRHAVAALTDNPRAGAVYGEGYLIDENGATTRRFPCTEAFNLWKLVHASDYILQQTTYFRREVLDQIGYLREDLHYAMDWDLLIRIAKRYPLHYIPEYMGCLREYPAAKSFSGGGRRAREIARVLREHTGMRYPPGSIIYGLDTYLNIWCQAIESGLPRPIAKGIQILSRSVADHAIGRRAHGAQGLYNDGWAGPRVKYMLPPGSGRILAISGWVPPSLLSRQTLELFSGPRRIARRVFKRGDFEWRIPIPDSDDPLPLEIHATRYFIPVLQSLGLDRRRLAYRVRSIAIEFRTASSPAIHSRPVAVEPSPYSERSLGLISGRFESDVTQ